ncbi:hypothetical protein C8C83_2321 [Flavobacterium sp. 90]|uniref:hypothetical protein n=1 Tax=unclassified Flavobacterium TaxID=196869 RepID=UPI000EB43B04|nr:MULTISPECIES: hypothetical protein [unclassified Flavobacterium]RKR10643.1 hypothetical protein C8C82_2626 [Flavobacterium sp. 81]TCK54426.1 hypothetical protein C8C83_2321 [Flavobacterium sp. 90]
MKKKLEADLISIAHRILKLKNKSDINQLYLETQKLYEKLAVLKFVDENFDTVKPTITHSEITAEVETIFEKDDIAPAEAVIETPIVAEEIVEEKIAEPAIAEPVIVEEIVAETPVEVIPEPVEEIEEEVIEEPVIEKVEELEAIKEVEPLKEEKASFEEISFTTISDLKPIPNFIPAFELDREAEKIEDKVEEKVEVTTKPEPVSILFEDFGINYADAEFVKVDSFEAVSPTPVISEFKEKKIVETVVLETPAEPKVVTLNEKLAKGFHIDLNDRIAFTKNLFGNSSEDYSRVLNQLLTFDSYTEAVDFIENMVKPDYNNWVGKDDYAERFLGIVEKKFS